MDLMRCLYSITAKFKLLISASHLAEKSNTHADALSRNNASHFLSTCTFPQALRQSTAIPAALMDLLVGTKPDWTSPSWSRTFSSIFKQPSPKHSYTSGYHQYTNFCSRFGYQLLPTSDAILCHFVSLLRQQQHKHKILPVQHPLLSHHQQ